MKKPTDREFLISQINEKLEPTDLTFEKLEEKYSDESKVHFLLDSKGFSIWFNPYYMEIFNRKYTDYLNINCVDMLTKFNEEHPFTEIFIDMLQNQHKELISNYYFYSF